MSENEKAPETEGTPDGPGPAKPPEGAATGSPPEGAKPAGAPLSPEEALRGENAKLLDRLLRVTAEFENYKKRTARERAETSYRAIEGLIAELLPTLDAFDRALASADKGADTATLSEGIRLTRRLLDGALAARGLTPIEALGKPFDPAVHDAFTSRPAAEGEVPGTVVDEVTRGYRLGDRTVRPASVVVAAAAGNPQSGGSPKED